MDLGSNGQRNTQFLLFLSSTRFVFFAFLLISVNLSTGKGDNSEFVSKYSVLKAPMMKYT